MELIHYKSKIKREYYKLKNISETIVPYLEVRFKEITKLGNLQEEKKLQALLAT